MRVNVARIFEDNDYQRIRNLCDDMTGWTQVYSKGPTNVWVQNENGNGNEGCSFNVIKARSTMHDVPASLVYDVLHDPTYRKKWDKHMSVSKEIGMLNPNNDVNYYAVSAIPPIRGRDFVMQRSWLDTGDEKLICSHSICHDDFPPQKGFIRGTIHVSGYIIRRRGDGCEITYVTHSDPKGKLPSWLVNRLTKVVAPSVIKKLHKACLRYPAWKATHNPNWKPWLFPEQMLEARRISLSECQSREYVQEIVDESKLDAKEFKDKLDDDED